MPNERYIWDRVEIHTRSDQLEEGLQARVADPLWFLARQWQTGEFRGEDAATPIHASLEVGWQPLASFRNHARKDQKAEHVTGRIPLEVRVEAMDLEDDALPLTLAVESGLHCLRLLSERNAQELRPVFREAYSIEIRRDLYNGLPEAEVQRMRLLTKRGIDGRKIYNARHTDLINLGRSNTEKSIIEDVISTWRKMYDSRFNVLGQAGDSWIEERLEHAFSVGGATGQGEVVLAAREYVGGHLDWYSFDITTDPDFKHSLKKKPLERRSLELLPVPLAYGGMPNSRWWEFEEGSVYFGSIEGGPTDIGRLCLAEYATIYSDDWFLFPVRLPAGSLTRVTRLRMMDTFGKVHRILPVAYNDMQSAPKSKAPTKRPWAFFELSGDPSPHLSGSMTPEKEAQVAPWLFLPSSLMGLLFRRPP